MKLAFVLDPLEKLKAYKDSSVAMMREAARRGHEIHALEAKSMFVREGSVSGRVARLAVSEDNAAWYRADDARDVRLAGFDLVLMRKDPPFDQEYYYATLLLDRVEAEGTPVVNSSRAYPHRRSSWNSSYFRSTGIGATI